MILSIFSNRGDCIILYWMLESMCNVIFSRLQSCFFFSKNGLILLGSVSLLLKTKKPCIGLVKMVITLDILNHLIYFDLILLTYAC